MNRRLNLDVHLQGTLKHNGPGRGLRCTTGHDHQARQGNLRSGGQVTRRIGTRGDPLARRSYRSKEYGLCAPV